MGAEDSQAATRANGDLRAMELQLARVTMNIYEITASGHAPRDDLNAPLVERRDFVKERLELEAATAQQRLSAIEGDQAEIERRVRIGMSPDIQRLAGLVDVARARAVMVVLAEKLASRAEFVAKGTSIESLLRRVERTQVQQDLAVAQARSTVATARAAIVSKQRKLGIVDETTERRAELEAAEPSIEILRLTVRLHELAKTSPEQ